MDFAYIRVSSRSQSYERQLRLLREKAPGMAPQNIYLEKKSGSTTEGRSELKNLLNRVREGDTIYVHSIDRLGRNLMDMLQIVRFLDGIKVRLVSVSQGIDSGTPTGRMFIMVCGLLAEMELTLIRERASEGIGIAKEKKRLGRPRRVFTSTEEAVLDDYLERRKTAAECMELLHISHSTFFRRIQEYKDRMAVKNDRRSKEAFAGIAAEEMRAAGAIREEDDGDEDEEYFEL